jgi:TonB family protein
MFILFPEDSVSITPKQKALCVSLMIHVCALIALMLLSLLEQSTARYKLMTVHAGSPEPVRAPKLIYIPLRTMPTSHSGPADPPKSSPHKTEISPVHLTNEGSHIDYTPIAIPPDVIALLATHTDTEKALGPALATNPTVLPRFPLEENLLGPPEPPPGDRDVKPPPATSSHIEPAVLIEKTVPVYPALARTARVEGIVVLKATINAQGEVVNVHIVSGHSMLVAAAIQAVEKWKYRPARLNGHVIPCPVNVEVRFVLRYPTK